MRGTQRPVLRGLDDFRARVQEAGPFLWLLLHFCSPDKEVFQHMLPIHRRNWVFADPAMDQSMREVGVSFHAHDLVARSQSGHTNSDGPFSVIESTPRQSPTVAVEKNHPQMG